jgi:LuxR family maltose regulon positive regulatory protein
MPRRSALRDPEANVLGAAVTLLVAPPGYGKTTLLAQWNAALAEGDVAVAWFSLDEDDRNFNNFAAYFAAALVGAGLDDPALQALLEQDVLNTALTTCKAAVVNSISGWDQPLVIILDDYHRGETPENDRFLDFVLSSVPGKIHVVIASRTRPDLQLGDYQMRGMLNEVGVAELAFSRDEMRLFFSEAGSGDDIDFLEQKLEGWAAGLQLARLWLKRSSGEQSLSSDVLSGRSQDLGRYLAEQVLLSLDEDLQDFLLQTSILERINGEVANAITGGRDGWDKLELIHQLNLFLMPIDQDGQWFRYHTLFAEFLRERLRRAAHLDRTECHRRAAKWFAEEGLYREAFNQARLVGDPEYFARLVEQCGGWRLTLKIGSSVLDVTKGLEPALLREFPSLGLGYVYTLAQSGQVNEALQVYSELRANTDDFHVYRGKDWDSGLYADSRAIEFILRLYQDDIPSVEETEAVDRLLHDLPDINPVTEAILINLKCFAYFFEARFKDTIDAGRRGIAKCRALNLAYAENYVYLFNGLAYLAMGQLDLAEAEYRQALARAVEGFGEGHSQTALAELFISHLLFERGDYSAIDQARKSLPLVEERDAWVEAVTVGYVTLAAGAFREAGLEAALRELSKGRTIAARRRLKRLDIHMRALEVLYLLRAGRTEAALEVLRRDENADLRAGLSGPSEINWRVAEPVAAVACLTSLLLGDIETAEANVEQLLILAETSGNRHALVTARSLEAIVSDAKGNRPEAIAALTHSLEVAANAGLQRVFVDLGPPFEALAQKAIGAGDLDPVLQTFLKTALCESPDASDEASEDSLTPDHNPVGLSPRETEILRLIADGYSNKEIAGEIGLAEGTIKTYRKRLYQKLEVGSRSQAIARARDLALIS